LRVPFDRVSLYDRVTDLALEIESYDLEPLEQAVSP
jgi:hypothetical protein